MWSDLIWCAELFDHNWYSSVSSSFWSNRAFFLIVHDLFPQNSWVLCLVVLSKQQQSFVSLVFCSMSCIGTTLNSFYCEEYISTVYFCTAISCLMSDRSRALVTRRNSDPSIGGVVLMWFIALIHCLTLLHPAIDSWFSGVLQVSIRCDYICECCCCTVMQCDVTCCDVTRHDVINVMLLHVMLCDVTWHAVM